MATKAGTKTQKSKTNNNSNPLAKTAQKKSKKAKSAKAEDPSDALLSDDISDASEELPDLTDFDENESDETQDVELGLESQTNLEMQKAENPDDAIYLTDAEGRRLCRVRDCDQAATVEAYCRFHYLQNWKRIQVRRKILADGKLERYVDELTSRYPDKFLEMIRKDLRSEKDFLAAIAELEIDESAIDNDYEEESSSYIEEVRGVSESTGLSDDDEY